MVTFYLSTLGLVPYFTVRSFVPLFMTALTARFGPDIGWIGSLAGIELLGTIPAAFISNPVLLVLGILAALEVGALKIHEVHEFVVLYDSPIKAVAATTVVFAVLAGKAGAAPTEQLMVTAGLGDLSFHHLWALGVGALVWFTAATRSLGYLTLMELDPHDDIGLQGLLSWLEDGIGFLGVLLAFILPALAVAVVALTLLGLFLTRRYLEYREAAARVPCGSCHQDMAPCGIACPACGEPNPRVVQVGWMGRLTALPAIDMDLQRQQLLAGRRCPICGDRYTARRVDGTCKSCGAQPFEDSQDLETYLAALRGTLPKTLGVLFALGMVPVFGLIPGVIYYRTSMISSLRAYLPRSSSLLTRWAVRLINLVLILLQPVPILGAFTLPLMGLTNFWVYQRALRRQGEKRLASPVPVVVAG